MEILHLIEKTGVSYITKFSSSYHITHIEKGRSVTAQTALMPFEAAYYFSIFVTA